MTAEANPLVVVTKDKNGAHRVYGPFVSFNSALKKRKECTKAAKAAGRADEAFISPLFPKERKVEIV